MPSQPRSSDLADAGYAELLEVILGREADRPTWHAYETLPAGVKFRARTLLRDRDTRDQLRDYWLRRSTRPLASWQAFPRSLGVYVLMVADAQEQRVVYVGAATGKAGLRGRLGEHYAAA